MQRLQGDGLAFIHAGGTLLEKELGPDEVLKVDAGCLAAFAPSVDYDIQFDGGFKNAMLGGEGIFLARLMGPGKVYLQSLPLSRLADRILEAGRMRSMLVNSTRMTKGRIETNEANSAILKKSLFCAYNFFRSRWMVG